MDERLTEVLGDMDRRLAAIESRLEDRPDLKKLDSSITGLVGGMAAAPVGVAVFAWLSGTAWAWTAAGAVGVATMLAAAVVLFRAL